MVTTERMAAVSPRFRARILGVVYLLHFLTAILGEVFTQQAGISGLGGVSGAAAATANTLLAHESAFRLGFALGLISIACYVAVTALFYQLFQPVSRNLAFLAVCFSLVGLAIQAFGSLFQLASLVVLGGSPYLSVFTVQQLQALALLFLHLNAQVGPIALPFDGLFLLLIGYLIFKSTFLPRMLGVLIAFAGLGWLTFLAPPLATYLSPYIQVLGFLAELSLMLWLLVMGVNAERWKEQAGKAREPDLSVPGRATGE
jgi:hypothetical protein